MVSMLRSIASVLVIATALLGVPASLAAQTTTQTVKFSVVSASRASFAGMAWPARRSIVARSARSATVGASSYAIETNESNQKIVASLDASLPAGATLAVALGAPKGARSAGTTTLGAQAVDVVTNISTISSNELPIVYTLGSTPDARARASGRTVTFTITAGE